jgi:hypothetical protein
MFGRWKKQRRLSDVEVAESFDALVIDRPQHHFRASDDTWQAVMRQKFIGLAPDERALMPSTIDGCRAWVDGSVPFGDFVIDN